MRPPAAQSDEQTVRPRPVPKDSRKSRWRILLWVTVVLVPIAVVSIWLLWFSSFLTVAKVQVIVTAVPSFASVAEVQDQVTIVADVPPQSAMVAVDTAQLAGRISALPAIQSVAIDRDWPDTLVITVTPRVVVAAARGTDGFDWVDAGGMVIQSTAAKPPGVPLVDASGAGLAPALAVAAALPQWLRTETEVIAASTRNDVELQLSGGSLVRWGSAADGDLKATVLAALLPGEWSVYDLSAPQVPTTS